MTRFSLRQLSTGFTALLGIVFLGLAVWLKVMDRHTPPLVVTSPHRFLDGTHDGQTTSLDFEIKNIGDRPTRLVGADDRCSTAEGCSMTRGLPLTIPPGESRVLRVDFVATTSPFKFILILRTDDPEQSELSLVVSG